MCFIVVVVSGTNSSAVSIIFHLRHVSKTRQADKAIRRQVGYDQWEPRVLHGQSTSRANLIILKRNSSFRSVAHFAGDWRALDCLFLILDTVSRCVSSVLPIPAPSPTVPWQSRSSKRYQTIRYLICLCSASIFSMIAFLVL